MLRLLLLPSLFIVLVSATLFSQVRQADQQTEDAHDSFGKRLEVMIEAFLLDVDNEFIGGSTIQDTVPKPSRNDEDIDQWRKPGASITFDGDKVIEEGETIQANVVVKGGSLTVFGTIDGDALIVGGTLYVKDGGRITGNARVINGDIVQEDGGVIEGYSDRTRAAAAGYRYDRSRFTRSSYRFYAPWADEFTNLDNFIYRFNRVEGHFIGLGSEKKYYWDGGRTFGSYGSVGWGFKSHRWRYVLGIDRQFNLGGLDDDAGHILEVGVQGRSLTDSKESWIIETNENTAAAIFLHEDYHDYFGREGFGAHTAYYYQDPDIRAQIKVEYASDRYESLRNQTEWSIFGGGKTFRLNRAVNEGRMGSVIVRPGFSTVERTSQGQEGWSIYAVAEFADENLGGDFSFTRFLTDVRRYQPLGRYDGFNVRLRFATSGGKIPIQRIFEAGGLGTLHARPYKSEIGNRMILVNAEYIFNGDFLGDLEFWPSGLLSHVNFLLLGDAAYLRSTPTEDGWTKGFDGLRLSDFRSDLGIGLSNRSGSFRVGFAWRTDVKAPARFFFRFTRPF